MQHQGIRMVSFNVNGMNNPIKRGKVLTKFRKEEVQVIFFSKKHNCHHKNMKNVKYMDTTMCFMGHLSSIIGEGWPH